MAMSGCGGAVGGGTAFNRGRGGSFVRVLNHKISWPVNPGLGLEMYLMARTHSCALLKSHLNCHIR